MKEENRVQRNQHTNPLVAFVKVIALMPWYMLLVLKESFMRVVRYIFPKLTFKCIFFTILLLPVVIVAAAFVLGAIIIGGVTGGLAEGAGSIVDNASRGRGYNEYYYNGNGQRY